MTPDSPENHIEPRILPYSGKTFVAFLDISGFKEMMKMEDNAERVLGKFYSTIYTIGRDFRNSISLSDLLEVNAIVVSDCAVLFPRNVGPQNKTERVQDKITGLRSILAFIQLINHRLISTDDPVMTTCSVAYGDFKYEDRIELYVVRKNFFLGRGYMNAFLDNENGKPRIQPGQCRLLRKDLGFPDLPRSPYPLSLLKPVNKHYYFHWMLPSLASLQQFEQEYKDTYQLKYAGMIHILKKYTRRFSPDQMRAFQFDPYFRSLIGVRGDARVKARFHL